MEVSNLTDLNSTDPTQANMELDKDYPFKVWSLMLVFAPTIMCAYLLLTGLNSPELEPIGLFTIFLFAAGISFVLSLPTLVAIYFLFRRFITLGYSKKYARFLFIISCLVGTCITFYIFLGVKAFTEDRVFPILYGASITISAFLCRISYRLKDNI